MAGQMLEISGVNCVYRGPGESRRYAFPFRSKQTFPRSFILPPLLVRLKLHEYTFQGFFIVAWIDNAKSAKHCGLLAGNKEYLTQVGFKTFTLY